MSDTLPTATRSADADPDELAGLTGVYYVLSYIGFLLPAGFVTVSVDITARLMGNGFRSGLASHSSSRTGRVPVAISPPRRSCVRRRTAIRFSR